MKHLTLLRTINLLRFKIYLKKKFENNYFIARKAKKPNENLEPSNQLNKIKQINSFLTRKY